MSTKPKLQVGAAYLVRWPATAGNEEWRGKYMKIRIRSVYSSSYEVDLIENPFCEGRYRDSQLGIEATEKALIRRCIWGNPKEELPF